MRGLESVHRAKGALTVADTHTCLQFSALCVWRDTQQQKLTTVNFLTKLLCMFLIRFMSNRGHTGLAVYEASLS